MPTSRTLPKFVVRCWKRPAPLNCQSDTMARSAAGQPAPYRRSLPTGTCPVPLRLQSVPDARINVARSTPEMEAEEFRSFLERVLITAVESQPI